MAESTNVRLVVCPKCENVLPEPEGYSVYQCGGCGAVLRAKNRERADSVLEKSEEQGVEDKNGVVDLGEASDVQSNAGSSRHEEESPESKSQIKSGIWVVENDQHDPSTNMNSITLENSLLDGDDNDSHSPLASRNLRPISGKRTEERIRSDGFRRRANPSTDINGVRLSISKHTEEGSSSCYSDSSNINMNTLANDKNHSNEGERAELLRKLDELKEQLTRSANVVGTSEEKIPSSSLGSNRPPMSFFGSSKHSAAAPHYYHHYPEPFSRSNGDEMPMHGVVYPSAHSSSHIPGYGDPNGFQMHRQAPQRPHYPYYSGQYIDTNHDLFGPYSQNRILHQPSCSCFHCYEKHRNQRFADVPYIPGLYPHENFGQSGTHISKPRAAVPPSLSSRGIQAHRTRWQSELMGHDMNGFSRDRITRVVLGSGANCVRPLSGGAPFLTCLNCFELLKLPDKANLGVKRQQKLQCGTCSSILDLSVINKKLVLSVNAETMSVSTEEADGRVRRVISNFSSDDYDNSGYEFHSVDREPDLVSSRQDLVSNKPQEMLNFLSSSSSVSGDENSYDSLPAKLPHSSSPLQDRSPNIFTNQPLHNRFGTGNRSARSEQEKVTLNKVATRQNSLKEASEATEMNVSYNEYLDTATLTQESVIDRRKDDQSKSKKSGESFFANIVKRSFKDITKSSQNEEPGRNNITVNGHLISERLVKRAEKRAGQIQPGDYWYDYRAGFWGVMGGPCLGIIPPLIEELNCPMPENCAGGNTGVFVNGRELHEDDLDLLATRGLPTSVGRSYTLDISGRVFDDDTGEELDSLGKIAPTVEKMKRGFGMKVPRVAS